MLDACPYVEWIHSVVSEVDVATVGSDRASSTQQIIWAVHRPPVQLFCFQTLSNKQ